MKKILIVLLILIILLPAASQTGSARNLQLAGSTENAFGYTVNQLTNISTSEWIELHGDSNAVSASFDHNDDFDAVADFGFDFPFFEHAYSNMFISINGFISFTEPVNPAPQNTDIPIDLDPGNFLAPFWDDLTFYTPVGDADAPAVYYRVFDLGSNPYLVIEWHKVKRLDDPQGSYLTFEAILYASGDIKFLYKDFQNTTLDEATVGIEDSDQLDGIAYYVNEPGLAANSGLQFVYPGSEYHVKLLSDSYDQLADLSGAVFNLTLKNTGTVADTYTLDVVKSNPDWNVVLQKDGQPLGASKSLNADEIFDFQLVAIPGDGVMPGEALQVDLTAESGNSTFSIALQAALPTMFVQIFNDQSQYAGMFAPEETSQINLGSEDYLLGGIQIEDLGYRRYLYAFTQSGVNKYRIFTPSGPGEIKSIPPAVGAVDLLPAYDALPGGNIGTAFLRSGNTDTDVYFSLLSSNGSILKSPLNLSSGSAETPNRPDIAINDNRNILVVWAYQNGDLARAVLDPSGEVSTINHAFTATGNVLAAPKVLALANNQFFLTYWTGSELKYQIINENGSGVKSGTVTNQPGSEISLTQLINGNVLITWIDEDTGQAGYSLMQAEGTPVKPATLLGSPDGRQYEMVSCTYDIFGNGVITWGVADSQAQEYLYYAVVDGGGQVKTSPMRFLDGTGNAPDKRIYSSYYGSGLAPLPAFSGEIYLPLVIR